MLASGSNFFCFCKFSSCVIYFKSLAHKLLWASVHPVSHVYVAHVGCSLREGQSLSFTSHYGGGIILKASLKWLHEVNPKSVTVTESRSSSCWETSPGFLFYFIFYLYLRLLPSCSVFLSAVYSSLTPGGDLPSISHLYSCVKHRSPLGGPQSAVFLLILFKVTPLTS